MAIKSHNGDRQVGIPNKDIKVKATTHQHFMLVAVCHFSYGPGVPFESLNWVDGQIIENFFAIWMIFETLHYLISLLLLSCLFFCAEIIVY